MMRPYTFFVLVLCFSMVFSAAAQAPSWQQRADYLMQVKLNVKTHMLQGTQQLTYYNQSPDTLRRVYYHLYFNAFQPGSMMDVRSRSIEDPDRRVQDRMLSLKDDEMGYQRVLSLKQAGQKLSPWQEGTILVVDLEAPLLPGQSTVLDMTFEAQVPVQIRRSGRDNAEGIAYSMSQWYPKIAEYDHRGWHATPYVGREFHGVWGNFDVSIEINADFVVAATGLLQTPEYYEKAPKRSKKPRSWRFVAEKVHDFAWAADKNYIYEALPMQGGPTLYFFYLKEVQDVWKEMQPYAAKAFAYLNNRYGKYLYPHYTIVQGGDGGMEYPMLTLITGRRNLYSLVNVVVHEAVHSWYQGLLANNESLYAWMDEGFTVYATQMTMQHLFPERAAEDPNPLSGQYNFYKRLVSAGKEEAMGTMSDHFQTNAAYWMAAYAKGAIFQHQLSYVVGEKAFSLGQLRYFKEWKYRHPEPLDYIRSIEKESGLDLDWYYEYFVQSTHHIDYGIETVQANKKGTRITLARKGAMPMPIDLLLTRKDSSQMLYYMPLRMMWGAKEKEGALPRTVLSAWPWTHPYYTFDIPEALDNIARLEIDPSGRLADLVPENQRYPFPEGAETPPEAPDASLTFLGELLRKD